MIIYNPYISIPYDSKAKPYGEDGYSEEPIEYKDDAGDIVNSDDELWLLDGEWLSTDNAIEIIMSNYSDEDILNQFGIVNKKAYEVEEERREFNE